MADRSALAMIGLMLCAATILVMMVGGVVVGHNLNGPPQIDDSMSVSKLPASAH
jgi:hypothetical protein